jgi:hypothetical protein
LDPSSSRSASLSAPNIARSISGYRAPLGDASAEVLRLVSRDLDRPAAATSTRRRAPLPTAAE